MGYLTFDPAMKFFSKKVTERDRAVFEAGIALGMAIHQFVGIPIKRLEDVPYLEKVIENAILSQPFREMARVKINIEGIGTGGVYSYTTLKTRHMDITVVVKYGNTRVRARLRYIPELDFNLAYIEDIEEIG
ncbi:MAG: dihydroneopterin aldolase family protein [Desulfurococcaceae archaeon]